MGMINEPAFMLTLPRRAQRLLPQKHQMRTEEQITGVMKKKVTTVVVCLCGWVSEPLSPEDTAQNGAAEALKQHLREEALKL